MGEGLIYVRVTGKKVPRKELEILISLVNSLVEETSVRLSNSTMKSTLSRLKTRKVSF